MALHVFQGRWFRTVEKVSDLVTHPVREVLNSIHSGVYITDRSREIVFWNRGAEEITGYSEEEVLGSSCQDQILRHVDRDGRPLCTTELCPLHRTMSTDRPAASHVLYALTSSGDRVPVSVSTSPVHDEGGDVVGGIEIFRDEHQSMQEMQLARAVQEQMQPAELPGDDRVSVAAEAAAMEMVGGDYYHAEEVEPGNIGLFLADIIGHGVSAALYMSLLHSLVRECRSEMSHPAGFLRALNERICDRLPEIGFVTAVAASIDCGSGEMHCCSAGHPPVMWQKADGDIEMIGQENFPLGVPEAEEYAFRRLTLSPGDRVLAYTDGAIETQVEEGKMLEKEGLAELLREHAPEDGAHRLEEIYEAIVRRCSTHMPEDDITLLSCMRLT
jgi:PAS domain S-box-containing protein